MTDVTHPAPTFSLEEALRLSSTFFGVSGSAKQLDSERDQNFRIDGQGASGGILKIVNASEPRGESAFQVALLEHLEMHAPDLPVPRLKRTIDGTALAYTSTFVGAEHALRMVSWLAGQPLAATERSGDTLESLGRLLGKVDLALQGFIHPGALRSFDWDIRRAGAARERLRHIEEPADQALLAGFIDHFEADVAPRLRSLRAQVIHNDANDWNVLVDPADPAKVTGLIDFGDALHSPLIADVAVAAAYAILGLEDPLDGAARLAAGFHAEYPLREEELDLLFDLIAMRLVTSVTLSAARREKTTDNPYLAISEAPAWRMLRRLGAMNRKIATAILRHACGFEALSGARAVTAWIDANRDMLKPVLDRHPATLAKAIVPFGDPRHPMTVASAEERPADATAWWDAWCGDHDVELGIGPWGEKRIVYTSGIFVSKLIDGERRDHHLGLDLFMPAGTKLCTPLAAVVRSADIEPHPLGYGCVVVLEHQPAGCPPFLTLWGHMASEAGHRLKPGDRLAAGALVGEMGPPAENGGWAPHLHFQISTDTTLSADDILGVGEARYLAVWAELFPDAATLAGLPPETFGDAGRAKADIVAARKASLLRNLSISYSEPIKFVRGEGVWLIDEAGRAYLDCFNNVCHLGHAHPDVVEAIARQAARLNTNTRYLHDTIVTYAERLTATLPAGLSVAAFACSGSEANSLMLRLARAHTGRDEAIVLDWAYHGTTQELIDLSPYKYKRKGRQGPAGARLRGGHPRRLPRSCRLAGRGTRQTLRRKRRRSDRRDGERGPLTGRFPGGIDTQRSRAGLPSRRLPQGSLRDGACRRRRLRCRRGAGRFRAGRQPLVGFRAARGHPGRRHDGQADRQRPSDGGGGDDTRHRQLLRQRYGVLQHLRRQPGLVRCRSGRARRHRARWPARERQGNRRLPAFPIP